MKVTQLTSPASLTEEGQESLVILINEEKVFSAYDGEPEDNTLSRNFNDCFNVVSLMRRAYDAGKAGEEFVLTIEEDFI